jgi:hypothetical protein
MTTIHEFMIRLRDGRMLFGYYDSDDAARAAIAPHADQLTGAWKSLNPIRPDSSLLAALNAPLHRSAHRAGIADVLCRSTLLIDFDAVCASDVMSNDAEHVATITESGQCREWLTAEFGWPLSPWNDSGRGCQLLPAVDLPADASTDALLRDLLRALKSRYRLIDAGMSDRPRLARLPGFWNRKSASPTPERPWRMAKVLAAGDVGALVTRQHIEAVVTKIGLPASPSYRGTETHNPAAVDIAIRQLADWLDRLGVELTEIVPLSDGRTLLRLSHCPLYSNHVGSSNGIGISVSGRALNMCQHASCSGTFSEWQKLVEQKTGVRLQLGRRLVFTNGKSV